MTATVTTRAVARILADAEREYEEQYLRDAAAVVAYQRYARQIERLKLEAEEEARALKKLARRLGL